MVWEKVCVCGGKRCIGMACRRTSMQVGRQAGVSAYGGSGEKGEKRCGGGMARQVGAQAACKEKGMVAGKGTMLY